MMSFVFVCITVLFSFVPLCAQETAIRKNLGHPRKRGVYRKKLRRQQQRRESQKKDENKQAPRVSVTTKVHPVGATKSLLTEPEPISGENNTTQKNKTSQSELEKLEILESVQKTSDTKKLSHSISSLYPKGVRDSIEQNIEVNLNKTDLPNFLQWIESIFHVSFVTGDALNPTPKDLAKLGGNSITYRTNKPLNKKQAWQLFLNFLELLNLSAIPFEYENDFPVSYNIIPSPQSKRAPLPAFIGTDYHDLPNSDTRIRYVYFVQNAQVNAIYNVILDMISKNGMLYSFKPLNALIFSDLSSNVIQLMKIVTELDNVSMPQALSVLKLKHANAEDVEKLYDALVKTESGDKSPIARIMGQRKQSTAVYFPSDTRVIAEARTNSLIILGNQEGIHKVENFIINHVDTSLKQPYSPLYVYKLEYANAETVAGILKQVTNFAPGSPAAQYGGVRNGDKYFRKMNFVAEPAGNRLLIKAEKEDYLKVRDLIEKLDTPQPQIAIEVLIVEVIAGKVKELGTQIRNKRADTLGNLEFQTSGVRNAGGSTDTIGENVGIIPGENGSLMGNLVQLAIGQVPGSTLISLGSNMLGGVWALFKALETYLYTNVVSHPFLTTTNKYTAQVSLGTRRRVQVGTVQGTGQALGPQGDVEANLAVKITPQINSTGIITLEIEVLIEEFTDSTDPTSANKTTKVVKTLANVSNKEVLAIGGLLRTREDKIVNKVPLLGNIPIIGWIFKNKSDERAKDNLLVFISPQIVEPRATGGMSTYSKNKAEFTKDDISRTCISTDQRDPIHRWFFGHEAQQDITIVDDYLTKADYCQKAYENWWGTDYSGCTDPTVCPDTLPDCGTYCASSDQKSPQEKEKPLAIAQSRKKKRSLLDALPKDSPDPEVHT